jgi:hypothetical protein
MRKLLIGLLVALLVVSLSFATATKDELGVKIKEMKAAGLYDADLWNSYFGENQSGIDVNRMVGGDDIASCGVVTEPLPFDDLGNTCSFMDDYDETCPYGGSTSPDVVYCYTPSADVTVTLSLCNPGTLYDTKLYVYENAYTPGAPYACNDDYCPGYISEIQDLFLTGGNTYYIVVDGYGGGCGDYELTITESGPPPPPTEGQDCSNPIVVNLPADLPYYEFGQTTCGMLDDYNMTCLGSYDDGEDIIYELDVASAIDINIEVLTGTYMYVGIAVDVACPPGSPCLYYSTNYTNPYTLGIIHLEPGVYYMMIDTWPSPTCIPAFDLEIEGYTPPPPPCDMYWGNSLGMGTGATFPYYGWRDVTTNEVIGLGDDAWMGPFPIGFTFPYFGVEDYTEFCICSNGFVMLGSTGSTSLSNTNIPNSAAPNGILPFFWDDMNPADPDVGGTHIYWGNDTNGDMVISFINLPEYGATGPDNGITAQVILKPDGNVKYQYAVIGSMLDITSATIGVENGTGFAGIEYLYNTVTVNPLQDGLAIQFGCDPNALPVELTSFEGVAMNNGARLNWTTASESDNSHFVLYRSTSPESGYTQVATVDGAGQSATESNYSYVDRNLVNGTTYYYHIADVDINGNATTHDITVNVTPTTGAMGVVVNEYKLHQNYPNPFNPTTTITYDVKETGHVTLTVFNIVGQQVATLVDEVKDNNRYQVTFDASGLAAGVYFYRLNVNDFSDVAKMVILK